MCATVEEMLQCQVISEHPGWSKNIPLNKCVPGTVKGVARILPNEMLFPNSNPPPPPPPKKNPAWNAHF